MSVTIQLEAEAEAKLRDQAADRGSNLEDYLSELAQNWAVATGAAIPVPLSQDEWEKEWRAWATGHLPSSGIADDSRDSIYAGRGE